MWARRAARALRRAALLLPLALLAAVVLLLPRAPPPHGLVAMQPRLRPPLPVTLPQDAPHDPPQHLESKPHLPEEATAVAVQEGIEQRPWYMKGGEKRPQHSQQAWPLFPEDAPGDDRIVQQLMYTLPEDELAPVKKILLPNGLGAWGVTGGRSEFLKNRCPVDRCSLTGEIRDVKAVDAVLFRDHVHDALSYMRSMKQIWIMYYLECPYHTASMVRRAMDMFNWTATYRRDSDIVAPYERWVYHDPLKTENHLERNYAANKTKKVAWFVSNCHARNKRLQYARQLAKHISVDIYGACGSLHCPRNDPYCHEMLDRDYKFYLAFENSNCRDYITEKFFVNGLSHDVLPIVMGARPSEYAAVAPRNSYIHVEEFAGPEQLAAYLHQLDANDQLYNAYFKWKDTGEFINTYFFCRVCAMLHAAERQQRSRHYTDVQVWWRERTCTRDEWRETQIDSVEPED